MFGKILCPTDFSEHSTKLVEALEELKKAGLREVVLVHVVDIRSSGGMSVQFKKHALQKLEKVKESLESKNLRVDIQVPIGVPFLEIIKLAKSKKVSMILMASHGKSFIRQMLLGSTSENVLRNAPVPLMLVKYKILEKSGKTPRLIYEGIMKKILYPTDFSDCAEKALDYVKELIRSGVREVVVIHVQDTRKLLPHLADRIDEFNKIDEGRLARIKGELEREGARVKTIVAEGVPHIEINRAAENENASMIVMGSHGRSMVKRMLLGSVCWNVVAESTRPVLVIRRELQE
jgi:nucleotide-binding universal stress UspA family protein